MVVLGFTGGVGSGKSAILQHISKEYNAKLIYCDNLAKQLISDDLKLKEKLKQNFINDDVFDKNDEIDRDKLSDLVFKNKEKLDELNALVHPAVKTAVKDIIKETKASSEFDLLIVEAALLLEEKYDKIFECIYVYADEDIRRERLLENRGYSYEKSDSIMSNQLSDEVFRDRCAHTIDNSGDIKDTFKIVDRLLKEQYKLRSKAEMAEKKEYVFGLDIGTRNVVGTVGYMENEIFKVLSQVTMEHKSRSMIDGQIHDIEKVSKVVAEVKAVLEENIGFELKNVCIAAAGRVLQTITTRVEYEYEEESIVTGEDLYTLDLLGVDKAHKELTQNNQDYKFYCVGYTVMKYYLNGEEFTSLEGHKAEKIEEDVIVTFLPEDVVDGLYTAVERAGLSVANLTLEPIAAINVAIPENYRMLNISLVDVGAGTSDICITDDGAIIAYGMIPYAGDELTEVLVKKYLVDFANAEKMKKAAAEGGKVEFEDIMGITHVIEAEEVWKESEEVVEKITQAVSEKIVELNGGKSVAAVFVVGGGGKAHGFCDVLADKLGLIKERVALRGEDVMKLIEFEESDIKKDPLLVTPIGICLNYFEQRNSFIMIRFNGEIMKLYDNGYLKIVDAAMQAGLSTEEIFPKRGEEINFTVNGVKRMERGHAGESAKVYMNGREVGLNDTLLPNCEIKIEGSTAGESAKLHIEDLEEFKTATFMEFNVNEMKVKVPRFVEVNGEIATAGYEIKNGDSIDTRPFYTVGQLAEFMDVVIDEEHEIRVNNRVADMDTIIYENFSVEWTIDELAQRHPESEEEKEKSANEDGEDKSEATKADYSDLSDYAREEIERANRKRQEEKEREAGIKAEILKRTVEEGSEGEDVPVDIMVTVNGTAIKMTGKSEYIFVDIYNYYDFNTESGRGKRIVTRLNGGPCSFADVLHDGDVIDLYWENRAENPL